MQKSDFMESFNVGRKKHHPYQTAWEELSRVHTVVWALRFPLELFAGSHYQADMMAYVPENTE